MQWDEIDSTFFFPFLKSVIAQINNAIGAAGVVSQECKAVVAQYGKTILDKMVNEVLLFVVLSVTHHETHSFYI